MAIQVNDLAGRSVCHIREDILRELLGHNFMLGLRTLKPKKRKNLKKLKTFFKPSFSSPGPLTS